jgi:hypothetical protein
LRYGGEGDSTWFSCGKLLILHWLVLRQLRASGSPCYTPGG